MMMMMMMMMVVVVVVVAMMMIKIMIINNFLNGDERHEDEWKLCRFLLKICPKRLNFVGFSEQKILTPPPPPPPIRKPAILRGVANEKWDVPTGHRFLRETTCFEVGTSPVLRGPQKLTCCVQRAFWGDVTYIHTLHNT